MTISAIDKQKVDMLLENVREAYYDTLDIGEYGSPDAAEIILGVVLTETMKLGISHRRRIEKVLKFLAPHPEFFEG